MSWTELADGAVCIPRESAAVPHPIRFWNVPLGSRPRSMSCVRVAAMFPQKTDLSKIRSSAKRPQPK